MRHAWCRIVVIVECGVLWPTVDPRISVSMVRVEAVSFSSSRASVLINNVNYIYIMHIYILYIIFKLCTSQCSFMSACINSVSAKQIKTWEENSFKIVFRRWTIQLDQGGHLLICWLVFFIAMAKYPIKQFNKKYLFYSWDFRSMSSWSIDSIVRTWGKQELVSRKGMLNQGYL